MKTAGIEISDRPVTAEELLTDQDTVRTGATAVLADMSDELLAESLRLAAELRAADISAEISYTASRLGKQLGSADKRGARVAVILGDIENTAGTVKLKHLVRKEETTVPRAELVPKVRELLE